MGSHFLAGKNRANGHKKECDLEAGDTGIPCGTPPDGPVRHGVMHNNVR